MSAQVDALQAFMAESIPGWAHGDVYWDGKFTFNDSMVARLWPGFPERPAPSALRLIRCLDMSELPSPASALFAAMPGLHTLCAEEALGADALEAVYGAPAAARITTVTLDRCALEPSILAEFVRALPGLEVLEATECELDDRALEALALEDVSKLRTLSLGGNKLGTRGMEHLARARLTGLRRLNLAGNEALELSSLRALSTSRSLGGLEELTGFYGFGEAGRAVIRDSALSTELLTDF